MYRVRLATLRTKTCAALNGMAESTVPDTLAVPAIPAVCGGGGAAAHMLTPTNIDAATKLVMNLPIYSLLFRERIRPCLELHNFLERAFAAFLVPGRVHGVAGPEAAAFPAGIWIVDASRGVPGVEPLRVRNAKRQHLTGLRHQDEERVGIDVAGQHDILTEAERVFPIHLIQIEHVCAGIFGPTLEQGARGFVHCPSFGTVLPGGGRSVGRFALAAVELENFMSAAPVLPYRTIGSDRDAARPRNPHHIWRRDVDFRLARLRRIQSAFQPHERRIVLADSRTPDAAVFGIDRIRVAAEINPMVLFGVDRFVRLGPFRDLAVTVRVQHGRAPSL